MDTPYLKQTETTPRCATAAAHIAKVFVKLHNYIHFVPKKKVDDYMGTDFKDKTDFSMHTHQLKWIFVRVTSHISLGTEPAPAIHAE